MILKIAGIIIIAIIIGVLIIAKSKGVSPLSWNMHDPVSQKNKIAIKGFDPVSYFINGKAEKGNAKNSFSWKNVNWLFNSQENLEKFKEHPEQYEPQFGGWCAFAVSKGFTATPEPNAWLIYEGKLFLFADEGVKKQWTEQLPEILKTGQNKWTN